MDRRNGRTMAAVIVFFAGLNGAFLAAQNGTTATAGGTGPFATAAKVEINDAKGPIKLKREEQIAVMFLVAIEQIENDCELKLQRACSMAEAMSGAGGERLKFNPNQTDPNYTYWLTSGGAAWEAHATAKRPGLMGFCFMARRIGTTVTTFSASGKAGWVDAEIMGRSIEGDSFDTQ